MVVANIALRIYGGSTDKGLNPQPFVTVGDVPNGFSPILPTLVDEQQVWIITHAQNYTLYTTSSKRCHTVDDQPGQMLICLFFPPQKRLADGNSPLAMLDEILDSFSVLGLREGKLLNTSIDDTQFKLILTKYRLEDRPVSLPIMQGHSPASFCVNSKNQLDALMRHSRYDILASVGCLELGFNCKSSISLMASAKKPKMEEHPRSQSNPIKSKEITFANNVSSSTGGLSLEDDPIEIHSTSWGKKLFKIAALIIGILFGLFVVLVIVGMLLDDSDNQQMTETVKDKDRSLSLADEDSSASFTVESIPQKSENKHEQGEEGGETAAVLENKKSEEVTQLEAVAEAKKMAAERAKKAEEAAKKKEMENSEWQSKIQSDANKCPIQLRVGVRITSIAYTNNSVTYTVNYEELSKYDMSSSDKDNLASDRSTIIKKYGSAIPTGIKTVVIQKDKAGRTF